MLWLFYFQDTMKQAALALAQNKIDYIVFHNPNEVAELLYNQGFEPPNTPEDLSLAIKELTRKKGRKFIEELVKIHPDKQAILSLDKDVNTQKCGVCKDNLYDTSENYCKGCGHSNYLGSGDEDSFLAQFEDTKDSELEKYYKSIVRKSNTAPEDKNLAQEVQMVWNEIRQRKSKQDKPASSERFSTKQFISRDDLLIMGIVFIAGALVGHGLKFNINNG